MNRSSSSPRLLRCTSFWAFSTKVHSPDYDSFHASVRRRWRHSRAAAVRSEFSIVALIGIILLIGIVKKNAIMMIDFALEAERVEGKTPLDAILRSVSPPLPPHHDDHVAALLGGLPLAARFRRWLRAASSTRHHYRRRPHLEPNSYALHDACCLSRIRIAGSSLHIPHRQSH